MAGPLNPTLFLLTCGPTFRSAPNSQWQMILSTVGTVSLFRKAAGLKFSPPFMKDTRVLPSVVLELVTVSGGLLLPRRLQRSSPTVRLVQSSRLNPLNP